MDLVSVTCFLGFCDSKSECCDGSILGSSDRPPTTVGDGGCSSKRAKFDSSKSKTYVKDGTEFNDTAVSEAGSAVPQGSGFLGMDVVKVTIAGRDETVG
ncbi:hypothetical protein AAVH_08302 [Aphelenchoides avenae]|nr:hypothetical protein AAVH_08302 [Aphelenchus avenae]